MKDRVVMASVCLHLSSAAYLVLGLVFLGLTYVPDLREEFPSGFGVAALIFCVALVVGIEAVAFGLRRRKFWAWVAGLCIFGLYVPSLFLPLGAFGLWGLLSPGTRSAFGVDAGGRGV